MTGEMGQLYDHALALGLLLTSNSHDSERPTYAGFAISAPIPVIDPVALAESFRSFI
jgi:hypothetical protein